MSSLPRISCAETTERAPFFVLGALPTGEAAEVREHLAECPQPHDEFGELGAVTSYLAELPEPVEPPERLRRRVMDAVHADVRARRRDDTAAARLVGAFGGPSSARARAGVDRRGEEPRATGWTEGPTPVSSTALPPVYLEARRPRWRDPGISSWLMRAAAVALLAILGAWNLGLQHEVQDARTRANVLRDAMAAASRPDASLAQLSGSASVGGMVVLPPRGEGYLVARGLPPAPAGKTYQAWYLADGKSRSAGFLMVAPDGWAVLAGLRPDAPVDQIALTIEPEGGSPAPTSPPLVTARIRA